MINVFRRILAERAERKAAEWRQAQARLALMTAIGTRRDMRRMNGTGRLTLFQEQQLTAWTKAWEDVLYGRTDVLPTYESIFEKEQGR